jgi:hypothetical protein
MRICSKEKVRAQDKVPVKVSNKHLLPELIITRIAAVLISAAAIYS